MKEEQKEFFDIMTSFRKLNISTMLPDINHGDFGILKMIDYCSERSRGKSVKVSTVVRCKNVQAQFPEAFALWNRRDTLSDLLTGTTAATPMWK